MTEQQREEVINTLDACMDRPTVTGGYDTVPKERTIVLARTGKSVQIPLTEEHYQRVLEDCIAIAGNVEELYNDPEIKTKLDELRMETKRAIQMEPGTTLDTKDALEQSQGIDM